MARKEVGRAHEASLLVEGGKGSPSKRKWGGKYHEGDIDDVLPVAKDKGKGREGEKARLPKWGRSEKEVASVEDGGEGLSRVSFAPRIILASTSWLNSVVAALEAQVRELEEALWLEKGKE